MSQQAEFLKNVRETFVKAQTNATQRLGALVEKGKASQKDISDRLSKIDLAKVAPTVEELQKRVLQARESALTYVDATGRTQAGNVAAELRKLADRLEKLAQKPAEAQQVH
jgi:hypothetical protein